MSTSWTDYAVVCTVIIWRWNTEVWLQIIRYVMDTWSEYDVILYNKIKTQRPKVFPISSRFKGSSFIYICQRSDIWAAYWLYAYRGLSVTKEQTLQHLWLFSYWFAPTLIICRLFYNINVLLNDWGLPRTS